MPVAMLRRGCVHSCVLLTLLILDTCFFVATAAVCDVVVAPVPAGIVLAYAGVVIVFVVRALHYFAFYRTSTLYGGGIGDNRLPAPTSELQPVVAVALYSAIVTTLTLSGDDRTRDAPAFTFLLVVWLVLFLSNTAFALVMDDRRALRAFVREHIQRLRQRQRGRHEDPPATRVVWSGTLTPHRARRRQRHLPASTTASSSSSSSSLSSSPSSESDDDVSWSNVSLVTNANNEDDVNNDDARSDVTEALFADLSDSRRRELLDIIKRR